MAHASVTSVATTFTPARPQEQAAPTPHDDHAGFTLWLLGLSAITLVFASLLSLGLTIRGGDLAGAAAAVVIGYVVFVSVVGVVSLAYFVVVGQKSGLLASTERGTQLEADQASGHGLRVAPVVPPRRSIDSALAAWPRETGRASPSLVSQHRQLPAAAATHRHRAKPAPGRDTAPRPLLPSRPAPPLRPAASQAAALQLRVASLRVPPPSDRPSHFYVDRLRAQDMRRVYPAPVRRAWPVTPVARPPYVPPTPVRQPAPEARPYHVPTVPMVPRHVVQPMARR